MLEDGKSSQLYEEHPQKDGCYSVVGSLAKSVS